MATSSMNQLIQHLRRAALRDGAGLTDGQLLEAFIGRRDEAALAVLVRRHGPMVWGVCQRVLRNHHDAEDAFQATFLVLVRRVASIQPLEMVANWLYGVAHQTALKARATAAKRCARERQVTEMPEPAAVEPDLWTDLQPILDQELSRLPDKHRAVIVLCDLEGKTRKEAARQLRLAEGTVASRLARARRMLAKRLGRRGLVVSGGSLAVILSANAGASVPASVVSSTIKAVNVFTAGPAAAGVISAQVAALTEGVVTTMVLNQIRTGTLVLMLAALLGGAGLFYRTHAAEPATNAPLANGSETGTEGPPADRDGEVEALAAPSNNPLPSGPMPRQALVSLHKDQLVVRTLEVWYEPAAVHYRGKAHASYEKVETLKTKHFDTDMVKVYDVRGKSINKKELPELLTKEIVALIASDVHAADPLNLRLFKDGTLLFVLPPSTRYPDNSTFTPPPVHDTSSAPTGVHGPVLPAPSYPAPGVKN
jgi:RNA polymerase sigma factor (sigma-70 family)